MGFGAPDLRLVTMLQEQGALRGRAIAEIGAQQLNDTLLEAPDEIVRAGKAFDVSAPPPTFARETASTADNELFGAPPSRRLWEWLGFDYMAIDLDGSPGSVALDLNYDEVPPAAVGRYHLVTNYGTTEHAANQLHAFKIIHDLTAPGGLMVHNVPVGFLNHGLVNYTLKFFHALAQSSRYEVLYMSLFPGHPEPLPPETIEYFAKFDPGALVRLPDYRASVAGLVTVYRKGGDAAYVPPVDVAGTMVTENAALILHYPTVFLAPEPTKPPPSLIQRARAKLGRMLAGKGTP